jgi:hypothetical protein
MVIAEWLMKYLSNGIDGAHIKILDSPQDLNLAALKHLDIAA